jgi:hypothetical protein
MISYKVGDVIAYTPFGGGSRTVTVTAREADIKNGRPGFDGVAEHGGSVWGYDDQIHTLVEVS